MPTLTLADFERDALETLTSYATIPCLSPMFDEHWSENGHLDRAVELLSQWARARHLASFDVSVHRVDGRTPMLCVTIDATNDSTGTAVLYGHLDKQPPLGDWSEGLDPFVPVRRGDRVFARGIADDGYSLFSALLAVEAMERHGIAHSRCVILIEASEESGSSDLDVYLDLLTEHLGQVELMICLDSGALTYDRLWVTNSLRGIVNIEVQVKVLEQPQHSGSVSGVVPSSFRILRQLLERVEDSSTGTILVEALHCPIPDEHRVAAHSIAQEFGDIIAHELPTLEGVTLMGDSAEERILRRTWYPTLSLVGMGGIPEPAIAGNVLRPSTTAVLSFRLPPSVDAHVAADALVSVLTSDVPSSAKVTCSAHAADGWVSPPLAPWLRSALDEASNDAFGRSAGFMGEGGSIPFLASLAKRYPGVQFVATGVLGPQSNAHGIDEMLDLPTVVGVTNSVITVLGAYAKVEGRS
ncbi:MAG: M20/M25/M40 family metallo-hydrolase [Acidobacteria bacterium]|nr:M20/M25/M40 family metallo-hydrolase [Acidobacteriota bacterium]